MTIKSNIPEVIARLKAFRDGVAPALKRAIAPERWAPELKAEADRVLLMEVNPLNPAELEQMALFLNTIGSAFLGNASQWWMSSPPVRQDVSGALADAMAATREAGGKEMDLVDKMTVQPAMEVIKEWVDAGAAREEEGKKFAEERHDAEAYQKQGIFDNQLVERIWKILGSIPAALGSSSNPATKRRWRD